MKLISMTKVWQGKVFSVISAKFLKPDGKTIIREYSSFGSEMGAVVLALKKGCIYMVEQTRSAISSEMGGIQSLELPAGKVDLGETPMQAAFREFEEETGLCAKKMKKLFTSCPSPGYSDLTNHIFQATGIKTGFQNLSEGEDIKVILLPIHEALKELHKPNSKICGSATQIGLLSLEKSKFKRILWRIQSAL